MIFSSEVKDNSSISENFNSERSEEDRRHWRGKKDVVRATAGAGV